MGFAFFYEATNESVFLERGTHFLKELQRTRCPDFNEYCWGYPFDWVTRNGTIKNDTPLITTTPYVYEAFLHMWKLDPHDEGRRVLESIARHFVADIKDFKTSETASTC